MVELGSIFMLMTLVIFVAYGICAAAIRKRVISRPRILTWMRRIFAGAFAALGASWFSPIGRYYGRAPQQKERARRLRALLLSGRSQRAGAASGRGMKPSCWSMPS